jgi:Zn-dependent peptidase ImmA (M78 family)
VFARGFKSWCETVAVQRRRLLGLEAWAPLAPAALANSLAIEVRAVDEVPGLDSKYRQALSADAGSWSAVTITSGSKSVVILNSDHSQSRSASDLMHELAHLIIGHSPGRIDITEDGALVLNTYERLQEDEANWLAGCLLLPRAALLWIVRQRQDLGAAAGHYGVSSSMLQFRLNVTGVRQQDRRTRVAGA